MKTIFHPLFVLLANLTDQTLARQLKNVVRQLQFVKAENEVLRAHLRERGDAAALHSVIRVNVALARAQLARQSIFAYDRTSRGAQDYQHVVEELLGTRRTVASRGTVLPFRHPRRGPGSRTAPKSRRAAHADSREPVGFHSG